MDKWILFFLWVIFAMTASTVGLILIMRWYYREVDKVKKAQELNDKSDSQDK
ncbi:hypothetical protein [Convivina praedatoris]|uniref:ATP synthase F0 subunit 8 n=1 Tax=Convivina praedatoris TaxID=2880963 RepID=A0ABM9D100_9LACO|nr:hypothetical protein [Convivina sp. LMG 32447]CAH1852327.1 hypothetical protein LMG032447_00551 [Convivina sp. LMG 32447]CAH1852370.1 hypothetical protein R078138_00561 [Convivina sp. LMG 32447]CAH1855230.1 hypothetical protein R077815_01180 [Convivina sp. LMG 32447]